MTTTPALAASPTAAGYDESGVGQVLTSSGPKVLGATAVRPASQTGGTQQNSSPTLAAPIAAPAATQSASSGSLPFTGLDVGIVLAAAAALLAAGFGLRRASRTQS